MPQLLEGSLRNWWPQYSVYFYRQGKSQGASSLVMENNLMFLLGLSNSLIWAAPYRLSDIGQWGDRLVTSVLAGPQHPSLLLSLPWPFPSLAGSGHTYMWMRWSAGWRKDRDNLWDNMYVLRGEVFLWETEVWLIFMEASGIPIWSCCLPYYQPSLHSALKLQQETLVQGPSHVLLQS